MLNFKSLTSVICATAIVAPTLLQAQSDSKNATVVIPPAPEENTWKYSIAPYLWASGLEGQMGVNGKVADIDMPLSDLLDVIDFAGYLAFDATKGDWGYYADFQYIKLSGSQATPKGFLADKLKAGMEQFRMEAGVKYRVYHDEKTTVRLMAGAMYTYFSSDLEIKGGPLAGSIDGSTDWIDPSVGISLDYQFNEKWNAHVVGQVGGFGVSSDITWQVLAGVGYSINDCWTIVGGYRHQYVDYENDGFLYDLDIGGPVLGAVYNF